MSSMPDAISDRHFVPELKADVLQRKLDGQQLWLEDERAHCDARGTALPQHLGDIARRSAAHDGSLDDEDVPPLKRGGNVEIDADLAGVAGFVVRGEAEIVLRRFDREMTHEFGGERYRAVERADDVQMLARIVARNLGCQFADACLDARFVQNRVDDR